MFSDKEILSFIDAYSKTPKGKQEIAKQHKGKFVAEFARDDGASIRDMKKIGDDMKFILYKRISKLIKSFKMEDIIVGSPTREDGVYSISIGFNEDALKRESLAPDMYPEGVSNIVKLFVNGYSARGAVFGVWKGHGDEEIWSLRRRDPNNFMDMAVDEFNQKYVNIAKSHVTDEYKNHI